MSRGGHSLPRSLARTSSSASRASRSASTAKGCEQRNLGSGLVPPHGQRLPQEIKELREEAASFPQGVTFEHVHAHCGDPGNEAADDLARQVTVGPSRSRSTPRDRSREHGRRRSLSNDPDHIRTHSAFVPPDKDINNNDQ